MLPLFDVAELRQYHLLPAVAGDLLCRTGEHDRAREHFLQAASLTSNTPGTHNHATPRGRSAPPNTRASALDSRLTHLADESVSWWPGINGVVERRPQMLCGVRPPWAPARAPLRKGTAVFRQAQLLRRQPNT